MSGAIRFDEAKQRRLSSIVSKDVKLRRAGNEWIGLCPFHKEKTPSFTVNDDKGFYHCFGCGVHGDGVQFIMETRNIGHREAVELILGDADLSVSLASMSQHLKPDRTSGANSSPSKTQIEAQKIWENAAEASGTPVESYLRGRGITTPLPPVIRFSRLSGGPGTGIMPCMVALVVDVAGNPTGIQRTFLREDGSGKADIASPKLCLGRISGGAIRVGGVAEHISVTGGLEDAFTLLQVLSRPAWAVTGEALMARLVLPDAVQTVTIGADNDFSGERAAQKGASAFAETGRAVNIVRPHTKKDWNAELMAQRERKAA